MHSVIIEIYPFVSIKIWITNLSLVWQKAIYEEPSEDRTQCNYVVVTANIII